nr:hypothetical protein Hi04_10k_c4246_00027 [uncultured bacterium]
MIAILICVLAFGAALFVGRRSFAWGLGTVIGIGYVYGITRANILQPASHVIFDVAVIGLYLSQLRPSGHRRPPVPMGIKVWVILLMAWPTVLLFTSDNDLLVGIVGWRANVFLLPFILLGSWLSDDEARYMGSLVAALNVAALLMAVVQFVVGIEPFFPQSAVTEIIYKSKDLVDRTAYRIPSTFSSAHAFGGTMVLSIPWLVGLWTQRNRRRWETYLAGAGLFAAFVGVFMAAARTHMISLAVLVVVITLSGQLWARNWARWLVVVAAVAWLVAGDARLQRFATLRDTEFISERIVDSVNSEFFDLLGEYPMGNGLGTGVGTSMPYFLEDRAPAQKGLENEYARIAVETGIPGLFIWGLFVAWVLTRRGRPRADSWSLASRVTRAAAATSFLFGLTGTGLLTSVPQTALLMLSIGWFAVGGTGTHAETGADDVELAEDPSAA